MAEINEFGEIIRNNTDTPTIDSTIPTFTPPKREIAYEKEGIKIVDTGAYEYHGISFDLQTLENLANRLESEIGSGKDENVYSDEILTIAMQMIKNAQQIINRDTQLTPQKEHKMQGILDKMAQLNSKGMLLSPTQLLKQPEKAQEYIMALQGEMAKQQTLDREASKQDISDWNKKVPNISAKTAYDNSDAR